MHGSPTAKHYRDTAEEVRETARRMQSKDIRAELSDLAECYDRLAIHAERRQRRNLLRIVRYDCTQYSAPAQLKMPDQI